MAETYQNEAKKQVEEAQKNVIFDISELHNLRAQNLNLSSENQELNNQLTTLLDQFSTPNLRSSVLKLAGTIMADESFAGGGETSDLSWEGRKPGEDEDSFARRCLLYASKSIKAQSSYKRHR